MTNYVKHGSFSKIYTICNRISRGLALISFPVIELSWSSKVTAYIMRIPPAQAERYWNKFKLAISLKFKRYFYFQISFLEVYLNVCNYLIWTAYLNHCSYRLQQFVAEISINDFLHMKWSDRFPFTNSLQA